MSGTEATATLSLEIKTDSANASITALETRLQNLGLKTAGEPVTPKSFTSISTAAKAVEGDVKHLVSYLSGTTLKIGSQTGAFSDLRTSFNKEMVALKQDMQSQIAALNAQLSRAKLKAPSIDVSSLKAGLGEVNATLRTMSERISQSLSTIATRDRAFSDAEPKLKALSNAHKTAAASANEHTKSTKLFTDAQINAHSAARGLAGSLGTLWMTYGAIVPLMAGAALGAGFKEAAKAGSEFAYQLTFVKALGGESAEAVEKLSESAKRLAKNGLYGPTEIASGYRILAQAGLDATQALAAMPHVLNLATVGEMSMEQAGIALVGVMNAFNLTVADSGHIADVFSKAAAVSQTSVSDMTAAMRTASVVGEQYGVSMEDAATAITLLAKVNITGTAAGTSLRNMLKELYSPGKEAAGVMKMLGLNTKDASGAVRPFADIIYDLKGSLEKFDKASQIKLEQNMFGERGAKEVVQMLSLTRDEWDKLQQSISDSKGFSTGVAQELENTAKGKWTQALNTMKVQFIQTFEDMEPAFSKLADSLKNLFSDTSFTSGLRTIVSGMVAVSGAILALGPQILTLAEIWVVYKSAMIGASVWTSISVAVTGFAASMQAASGVMGPALSTLSATKGVIAGLPALLTAIPNPLTIVAGLLASGAVAWALWGDSATRAGDKAYDAAQRAESALAKAKRREKYGVGDLAEAREELDQAEKLLELRTASVSRGTSSAKSPAILDALASVKKWTEVVDGLEEEQARAQNASATLATAVSGGSGLNTCTCEKCPDAGTEKADKETDAIKKLYEATKLVNAQAYEKLRAAELGEVADSNAIKAGHEILQVTNAKVAAGKNLTAQDLKYLEQTRQLAVEADEHAEAEKKLTEALNERRKVLRSFQEGTGQINVDAGSLAEQAELMKQYGLDAKLTAIQLAELSVVEARRRGLNDSDAEQARMSAAANKQLAQSYFDLTKTTEELNKNSLDVEAEGKLMFAESEADKIRIKEEATLKIIALYQQEAEAARALILMNDSLTEAQAAQAQAAYDKAMAQSSAALAAVQQNTSKKLQAAELKDWKSTVDKIEGEFHKGFSAMFKDGKDGWKEMTNSFRDMFKNTVVEYVYKAFAKPLILNVTASASGALGFSELSSAADSSAGGGLLSGAVNTLSIGKSAFDIYSGGSSLYSNFATSGIGSALGLSTGLASNLGVAGGAGTVMGSSAALAAAEATSIGGASALTGLGSTIGAAIPWIGGALAIGSMLGLFGGNDRVDSQGAKVLSKMTAGGDYSFEASQAADDYNTSLVDPAEAINKTFLQTVSGLFNSLGSSQDISFQTRMSAHGREGNKLSDGFEMTVGDQVAEVVSHAYGKIEWDDLIGKSLEWALSEGIQSAVKLSKLDESIKGLFADLEGSEQVGKMVQNISALGTYSSELNDVWGISIAQAAKVATTVSETNEALISNVGAMATFAAAQRSIGETLSTTYADLTESFADLSSADFPDTLSAYDAAMKGVNKTTEAGIQTFSDLFALRGQFAAFQAEIDTLRANADASVLSYRPDGDKAVLAQEALAEASRKAGVSVITSAGDLLRLADSIDYTTEAGINLALALPTLAAAFNNVSSSTAAVQNAQASRISAYLDAERAAQAVMIENQRSAYEDQLSSAQSIADEFRGIVESLSAYRRSLMVSEVSPLTPEQKYNETKRLLEITTAKARLGDVAAAGDMQSVTDDFLSAAKAFDRTSAEFAVDFGTAIANLDAVIGAAGSQASYAERQIALAQAQLDALNSISSGLSGSTTAEETGLPLVVDNFAQAMKDWQDWFIDTAIGETDTYDIGSTTRISQDKGIFTDTAGNSYVFSASDGPYGLADQSKVWAEEMLRRYGQWMAPGKVKGYASGGDFSGGLRLVGENGPELEVTKPSHIYSNADTKNIFDVSGMIAELRALREEVRELRAGQAVIAGNTRGTKNILERVTPGGDAFSVRNAA